MAFFFWNEMKLTWRLKSSRNRSGASRAPRMFQPGRIVTVTRRLAARWTRGTSYHRVAVVVEVKVASERSNQS